ncbi:MAG: hypothetical protein ACREP7_14040, partial [Lysobacter sp.]
RLTRDSMKTTLGVALTPPTAAALIAGACVLAAAFLPSCHARAPGTGEPPQITTLVGQDIAADSAQTACDHKPAASLRAKAIVAPALAPGEVAAMQAGPEQPATTSESGNSTRSQR